MQNNKENEKISTTQAKLKALNIHSMLASLIVIIGVFGVFLTEGAEKKWGTYVIVFGITYNFITRIRIWRNNK